MILLLYNNNILFKKSFSYCLDYDKKNIMKNKRLV